MISRTRKKLEDKRDRHFLTVGILDIACAVVWAKIADLSIAEGKKVEGTLEAIISGGYGFLAYRHIKSAKK